jgi:hypothetical protein
MKIIESKYNYINWASFISCNRPSVSPIFNMNALKEWIVAHVQFDQMFPTEKLLLRPNFAKCQSDLVACREKRHTDYSNDDNYSLRCIERSRSRQKRDCIASNLANIRQRQKVVEDQKESLKLIGILTDK